MLFASQVILFITEKHIYMEYFVGFIRFHRMDFMKSKRLSNSMTPDAIKMKIMMNMRMDPRTLVMTLRSAPRPAERDALGFSSIQIKNKINPASGMTNPKTAYPIVEPISSGWVSG